MLENTVLTQRDKTNIKLGDYSLDQLKIMIKNAQGFTVTESDRQRCNYNGYPSLREYFYERYPELRSK